MASLTSPGNGTFVSTTKVSTLTVGISSITVNSYVSSGSSLVAVPSQVTVTGANNGTDTASLYDGSGTNAITASGTNATLTNSVQIVSVNKFANVTAYDQTGSSDTVHKAAIDFTLATVGNWASD